MVLGYQCPCLTVMDITNLKWYLFDNETSHTMGDENDWGLCVVQLIRVLLIVRDLNFGILTFPFLFRFGELCISANNAWAKSWMVRVLWCAFVQSESYPKL